MRAGTVIALTALAWVTVFGSAMAVAADPDAATPEEVVSKVWAASRYLNEKGAAGFAEFNSKDGPWVWKDSYVFVYDCRLDRMVAHPMRPDLVGRPLMQITDNNGKFIFKELCKAGSDPRGGWVEYLWTKPGAGSVSRKISYAKGADIAFASGIQVAAGVYDDKVSVPDLIKLINRMSDPTKYPAH
ncbi:MAG: cache domain-containing protein [Rhodoplanes sp.]